MNKKNSTDIIIDTLISEAPDTQTPDGAPSDKYISTPPDEYSLEDDDDDVSEYPDEEEINEDDNQPDDNHDHGPNLIWVLIRMMINPVEGWKRIRRLGITYEDAGKRCFYPLAALAAASCFISALYDASITLNDCMIAAVKIFMALFFGNFLTLLMFRWGLPKEFKGISDSNYGKVFVMFNLSTLALFYVLYEILPMLGPVLVFLPIWTIYLSTKGCRFFHFPQEKGNLLMTLIALYILLSPIVVYWAFDILL